MHAKLALLLLVPVIAYGGPDPRIPAAPRKVEGYTTWTQYAGSADSMQSSNGPVVTAGGLIFLPNSQDRMLRAYDKDTGRVLWEHDPGANPEGIPAVYQVAGRQYVAFAAGASWGTGTDPVWKNPLHWKQGKIEAQGYHVFALKGQ